MAQTCAGLAAAVVLAGCQAPHAPSDMTPVPAAGNAELVEYIADQPYVTAEAGYRTAYVLWKGEAFAGDYAALSAALCDGGIAARHWKHDADQYLNRATTGYLICRAIGLRSGINWQLTGLGRYAWRELQYRNIAGAESEWGFVRGGEFLGIVQRADEYRRRREPAELELGKPPQ